MTQLAGALAGARLGGVTQAVIRRFIRQYQVNMAEAEQSDPAAFATFNEFFTRALKTEARPLHQRPLESEKLQKFGSSEVGAPLEIFQ